MTLSKVLNELISEKETKVRESLRMLGVRSFAIISRSAPLGFAHVAPGVFEGSHRKEDSDGSESVDGVKTNHPQSSKLDFRSSQAHGSLPMASSLLLYVQFSPLWPHSMQLASDHIRSCNFLERAEG